MRPSAHDPESDPQQQPVQARPTMLDLWRRHPASQTIAMIEEPGIDRVKVLYAFCGYPVTQQEFDAVLAAFNRLTGCHYRQSEIAGVWITPDPTKGENNHNR